MTTATYHDDRDRRAVDDVIAGYKQFVVDRVREGWHPHLATLMFAPLFGKPAAVIAQMMAEAEFAYKKFLTRAVRRPLSSGSLDWLPILIAAPDWPVGKHDKPLAQVKINDGLHFHGLLLMPPFSRLPIPVDEHFRQQQALYVGDRRRRELMPKNSSERSPLKRIDVRPVDGDVALVVDYVVKSLKRGRFSIDDVLILPRTTEEVRASTRCAPYRCID